MPTLQPSADASSHALERVSRRIQEISSLPEIAFRVMEVANDPDSGAWDLKEVIETDAALSTRIVRCANSSAFSTRAQITNLTQAIAYLGLRQVRNLAITANVGQLFRTSHSVGPYCRAQLWRHLVAVGVCSRLIAMRCRMSNFEEAFLAGLLHDLGIILADQHAHDDFVSVIASLHENETLAEVERRYLGFDHTMLGHRVAMEWGLPEPIQAAILHHHASGDYGGEHCQIVRCVEVANVLCTLKGISSVGVKLVRISTAALRGLGLNRNDIAVLSDDLDGELTKCAALYEV